MTTSGTTTFNYNRNQIITAALRKIGAIQSGETPSAQQVTDAADALNMMVKEWDSIGIHLWTESEGALFLQPGQEKYTLGTGSTDHATRTSPPNYMTTSLATNALLGATTISVASATNLLANDNIGIALDDGTLFWTTISGAPVGTTVTLAAALTDTSTAGNPVYDYTTPILRPLRVTAGRRFLTTSAIETPMIKMSRLDYRDLPNKTTIGIPTQFFYDPLGGATVAGILYIWPAPVDTTSIVKFTWERQIQDFNNPADTPDLPSEWIGTLVFNLAVEIALEYDLPPQRYMLLKQEAAEKLDRVQGYDREPESVYFGASIGYPFSR